MKFCSLALVGAVSLAPPPAGPEEPPRVFRSVLDERVRMITVQLGGGLWAAYDASSCALYGVWRGGVDFQGAVYDTVHGPQPTTAQPLLLEPERAPDDSTLAGWRAVSATTGEELEALARYRGYRLLDGDEAVRPVELLWQVVLADGRTLDIRERPAGSALEVERTTRGCIWFLREFRTKGLPEDVELQFPTGVWLAADDVAWTGGPCSVEGMAAGHCRWAGAEFPSEFPIDNIQMELAVAQAARRVSAWEAPEVAPRDWVPSVASLLADGRAQVCTFLYPFPHRDLPPQEEDD